MKKSKEELLALIEKLREVLDSEQLIIAYAPGDNKNHAIVNNATCVCLNGETIQVDSLERDE
jgi:hypothetical protein